MFPGFETLLQSLSPAKGISLVKLHLQNQLNISVKKFEILFDATERKVNYTVYNSNFENGSKNFPFEKGEKFIDIGIHYLSSHVPEGSSVDKAICQYEEKDDNTISLIGYLFYTVDGNKQSYKHIFS